MTCDSIRDGETATLVKSLDIKQNQITCRQLKSVTPFLVPSSRLVDSGNENDTRKHTQKQDDHITSLRDPIGLVKIRKRHVKTPRKVLCTDCVQIIDCTRL